MKRMLKYLKPHWLPFAAASILVLLITAVTLLKPIIIGNTIDDYINGYGEPYHIVSENDPEAVSYHEIYLSKKGLKTGPLYQIFLYQDKYYMAEAITEEQSEFLLKADSDELAEILSESGLLSSSNQTDSQTDSSTKTPSPISITALTKTDLKELRTYDFYGILKGALFYLGALILGFFLSFFQAYLLQKLGQDIIYELRDEVFTHIHTLSLNFFNTQPIGKLVTRVTNDTEAVNEMFSNVLVNLFKNIVKIIGYAIVMLSINVSLALYSFLLLPIIGVLTFVFRHLSREAYRFTRNKITDLNTFLSENLSGMKLIQIFTREKEKYSEFEEKNLGLFKAGFREVMIFAIFRPIIYLLSVVALAIVLAKGSHLVLSGTISIGVLFIFINYISSFFDPIQELAEQFGTLQSSIASAEKLFTILDEKPDISNCADPKTPDLKGNIEFKHVWFAYEKDDYILKDVSFTIHPGEKVAFVGATGAGKSSILNLIGRYFDIQKGEILIDGIDIREIDTDVLRRAIGQVQQDVFLFTGDIKGNISLRNENITLDQIKAASRYVNADSFIKKLPGGYDEPVTERGSTLSAGQRQLLSFARTLAYDPKILVLDEATANIDTETETLITEALEKLMNGRTTIMVAHRLSTIQHADKIIVMEKGRIAEEGSHQELLSKNGIYRKLYDLQLS